MRPVTLYTQPHQFEPLLPRAEVREALLAKAHTLFREGLQTNGRAHSSVMQAMAPLLRAVNSYYTNKIEGQHTLPREVEAALDNRFSSDADVRRRQRLALAHMRTEDWAEHNFQDRDWRELFAPEVIAALHRHLFAQLPEEDLRLKGGSLMPPGAWRTGEVRVGTHEAPAAACVPDFLARMAEVYQGTRDGELALVAVACAHHRLAWVHPFADGNGRVARLHSHLLLHRLGLTHGVWSPLRGLARTQAVYYERLAHADAPREGDLDGRGNLSERQLVAFCDYFLTTCIDQARFMGELLDLSHVQERIRACLSFESTRQGSDIRLQAAHPLYLMFVSGTLERGSFKRMTGLPGRSADRLLSALLARGLLTSPSPKGKLQFGIPLHALRFYFPRLWPEAEADAS
ncbi:Fic family protein [Ottowia sp.]|uniref:Fic family protein n=1 Tax=Ottowia sp. TaxID=1898956 RepID=UPI003A86F099